MAVASTAGPMVKPTLGSSFRASSTVRACTRQLMVCQGKVCGTKANVNSGCLKFLLGSWYRQNLDLILI